MLRRVSKHIVVRPARNPSLRDITEKDDGVLSALGPKTGEILASLDSQLLEWYLAHNRSSELLAE